MNNMHYVCSHCGGYSAEAKNCDTEGCLRNGLSLADCNCDDGRHSKVIEDSNNE